MGNPSFCRLAAAGNKKCEVTTTVSSGGQTASASANITYLVRAPTITSCRQDPPYSGSEGSEPPAQAIAAGVKGGAATTRRRTCSRLPYLPQTSHGAHQCARARQAPPFLGNATIGPYSAGPVYPVLLTFNASAVQCANGPCSYTVRARGRVEHGHLGSRVGFLSNVR